LDSVSYSIETKPGNLSAPINVTYSIGYLEKHNLVDHNLKTINLTVYGLYADYNNNVKIEVYEVSDELFTNKLDRLEGYPDFYNRMEVNTSFGKAWIYFLNDYSFIDNYSLQIVLSGDWKTYLKTYEKNNKVLS
jgi:gamma-glutamylcyclotransferase (GGCT)/AIG2-like uncharacterized protein YtfP